MLHTHLRLIIKTVLIQGHSFHAPKLRTLQVVYSLAWSLPPVEALLSLVYMPTVRVKWSVGPTCQIAIFNFHYTQSYPCSVLHFLVLLFYSAFSYYILPLPRFYSSFVVFLLSTCTLQCPAFSVPHCIHEKTVNHIHGYYTQNYLTKPSEDKDTENPVLWPFSYNCAADYLDSADRRIPWSDSTKYWDLNRDI